MLMYSNEVVYCIGNKPDLVCQGVALHCLCWQRFGEMGQGKAGIGKDGPQQYRMPESLVS